jgi:uncharacterized protein YecE (DUF72 family)
MASFQGKTRIGISGWRYEPWRGAFYPQGLRQRSELAFASRMLPTIEINRSIRSSDRNRTQLGTTRLRRDSYSP